MTCPTCGGVGWITVAEHVCGGDPRACEVDCPGAAQAPCPDCAQPPNSPDDGDLPF